MSFNLRNEGTYNYNLLQDMESNPASPNYTILAGVAKRLLASTLEGLATIPYEQETLRPIG